MSCLPYQTSSSFQLADLIRACDKNDFLSYQVKRILCENLLKKTIIVYIKAYFQMDSEENYHNFRA